MNRINIKVEMEELLLTPQQIHVAAVDGSIETIEEERMSICKAQVSNAIWKLSDILIKANTDAVKEFKEEPLWSLEDLGKECQIQMIDKNIIRPSTI